MIQAIANKKRLAEIERRIEGALDALLDIGKALAEIRDGKLYLQDYETFDDYCKLRWKFSRQRAYQLIEFAEVAEVVSTAVDNKAVPNERQARILSALPDERSQASVWTKAVETSPAGPDGKPKVSTAHVKKVAAELFAPPVEAAVEEVDDEPAPVAAKTKPAEPNTIGDAFDQIDSVLGELLEAHPEYRPVVIDKLETRVRDLKESP